MARYAMSSNVFATRVFNTRALAARYGVKVVTKRLTLLGTSQQRITLNGTSQARMSLLGASE